MIYTTRCSSPLGPIGLACSETHLVGLWLEGQTPIEGVPGEHPILTETVRWLDRYFAGEGPEASELPLKPSGTPFRELIWQLLLEIPWGETTTYGALAKGAASILGREKMSAQAVGGAVGANPISIIIPCHRVVGSDGSLTGYAGGVHYKQWLLEHEGLKES